MSNQLLHWDLLFVENVDINSSAVIVVGKMPVIDGFAISWSNPDSWRPGGQIAILPKGQEDPNMEHTYRNPDGQDAVTLGKSIALGFVVGVRSEQPTKHFAPEHAENLFLVLKVRVGFLAVKVKLSGPDIWQNLESLGPLHVPFFFFASQIGQETTNEGHKASLYRAKIMLSF